MSEPKPDRTEMWKALKWTAILIIALLIAIGAFKAWQIATAPARAVGNAADNMKSGASAVWNRLDIPITKQRTYDRVSTAAFSHLNEMPEALPEGVKDRGFRLTNLYGAQHRVCEIDYDFGAGSVPVFLAADNSAHKAAKTVGSTADRLIRIVIVSPEETLGLKAEFIEETGNWSLSWRSTSLKKPYPDDWAEKPITDVLRQVPKACVIVSE